MFNKGLPVYKNLSGDVLYQYELCKANLIAPPPPTSGDNGDIAPPLVVTDTPVVWPYTPEVTPIVDTVPVIPEVPVTPPVVDIFDNPYLPPPVTLPDIPVVTPPITDQVLVPTTETPVTASQPVQTTGSSNMLVILIGIAVIAILVFKNNPKSNIQWKS